MSPEEKKLEKLNALFELVNADFATPDDLIKLSEALLGIITNEKERIDNIIAETEGNVSREANKTLNEIYKLETRFSDLINKLQSNNSITLSQATKTFEKELNRLEKKIPTRTDLSGLEAEIVGIKDSFNTLPTELTMNNEAIRDGLELLQDDERLDKSAIKGLDELVEELRANGKNSGVIAGVRFLSYLADVNIAGITNGQTIVWDSASGRFIPGTGGTGGGHTIEDEGTPLTQRTNLNFVGADVTVTDDAGNDATVVTISGGGAVDSVNGQTGVVVIDADDIDDTSTTNKFTTQAEIDKLAGIETGAEVNNISDANADDLTDGGTTTLHNHDDRYYTQAQLNSGQLDSRYYTETETNGLLAPKANTADLGAVAFSNDYNDLSNLPDLTAFDNLSVHANQAAFPATGSLDKLYLAEDTGELFRWTGTVYVGVSTDHAPVTLAGTPNYITIVGQTITRNLINLTSHVTGRLPFANLSTLSAHQVLGRPGTGTGDAAGITMGNDTIIGREGSGNVEALSAAQVRTITTTETTTQLNTRDTNNRARANHTGTQLASTISDFVATVRSTILTGISFATSTAVTAADSILVAVGKLQAQNTAQDIAIALNTAKVTNATHTGEVTGSGALTVDKTAITNRTNVTAAVGDSVLISDVSDTNNLKKVTVQSIVNLASGGGNTIFNDEYKDVYPDNSVNTVPTGTVDGSNTVFYVSEGVYAAGTTEVERNGQEQTLSASIDYTESNPTTGEITFVVAPTTNDVFKIKYKKVVTNSSTVGDVQGPVSSTDNAITRYDSTTGKIIQDSTITINDAGDLLSTTANTQDIGASSNRFDVGYFRKISAASFDSFDGDFSINLNNTERAFSLFLDGVGPSVNNLGASSTVTGVGPGLYALGTDTNINLRLFPKGTGKVVVSTDLEVSDEAYSTGWNGSLEVPTKNAVYDAMITRVVRVVHGATAGTARPTGATYVEWIGSVEPTNATNNDTWIETT